MLRDQETRCEPEQFLRRFPRAQPDVQLADQARAGGRRREGALGRHAHRIERERRLGEAKRDGLVVFGGDRERFRRVPDERRDQTRRITGHPDPKCARRRGARQSRGRSFQHGHHGSAHRLPARGVQHGPTDDQAVLGVERGRETQSEAGDEHT